MKILFITPRFPYPPLKGDKAVPYHRLRILDHRHEITLLSLYEKDEELAGVKQLRQYCQAIHTIRLPKWRSIMNLALMTLFSSLPLQVLYYRSSPFQKKLDALLAENSFDLINVFMLRVAPYLSDLSTPKVLDLIDSMQLNFQRRAAMEHIPKRWLFKEELRRVISYERNIWMSFDHVIVVSEKDKTFIPGDNVKAISLGVDTDLFTPRITLEHKSVIVFSGNMGYAPNIHAIKWFVEHCLPDIKAAMPEVSLLISGGNPPKEVCNLGRKPEITVTGFVESMPDVLRQASVAIAPMQSGSGMQFKILEAMSCGLSVVTTTLGLGDIKARPGDEICVADTAEEFADTVVTLLKTPKMAERIGRNARAFVVNQHGWEHAAYQVEAIYDSIIDKRR